MRESSNASPSPTRQAVIAAYQNRDFCIARSFLAHLRSEIKRARLYAIWQGALAYFRRLRLLTVIARLIALLFSALQLGTTVLLTTVFLLILLPLLAVLLLRGLLLKHVQRTCHLLFAVLLVRTLRLTYNNPNFHFYYLFSSLFCGIYSNTLSRCLSMFFSCRRIYSTQQNLICAKHLQNPFRAK